MNFLDKLDALMARDGLNRHRLSIKSGVPYSTIDSLYKKGYERAKLSTLRRLADCFSTTLDYLMRDEITDWAYGAGQPSEARAAEAELLCRYRLLDGHGRDAVDFVLGRELARVEATRLAAAGRRKRPGRGQ